MESNDGRRRNKPRVEDVKGSVNSCYAGSRVFGAFARPEESSVGIG